MVELAFNLPAFRVEDQRRKFNDLLWPGDFAFVATCLEIQDAQVFN